MVSRSLGMAFATLVSRITGFTRIVLLAAILGAALSSAFTVANQLPNLIAALVLEATFTAIFVPVLARAERDDPDGGTAFVRRLVTLATTLLVVATVLSVAIAPLLVRLMLGSDPRVNNPLTTAFAYLLLPQVLFYGLSSVFMAILNTRNVFGPPAWAPVVNNIVAIATLGLYLLVPGELSVDPVEMGNAKLLVLGAGTTLGVFAQTAVLLVAIRRERISLRPLWGIDDRLRQFGAMAAAMVLYVLISQLGLVVGNQIASGAAASGPAIYNYTWLVLMLPFGMIGATVLTVVMPRLSRNAAADDNPAVLADLSLATRLTMVTLIPVVAFMTVGGPAIGSALFAYGNFGEVDAGYLGMAITLSAFTLIPYALVLLALRVFYAREQPWTPIVVIVVITAVKIAASLAAPHLTDDPEMVAGYLGLANGVAFLAGAIVGYILLRANLNPPGGRLVSLQVLRTILVTIAASLIAGMVAHIVDQLLGLEALTRNGGGAGSLLRLVVLGLIMAPIIAAVMLAARVPDAEAALTAVRRRLRSRESVAVRPAPTPDRPRSTGPLTYSDQRNSHPLRPRQVPPAVRGAPPVPVAGAGMPKGPAVTDESPGSSAPGPDTGATTRLPPPPAGDFEPDVPDDVSSPSPSVSGRPPADYGGDPTREPIAFDAPREPPIEAATSGEDVHLIPGALIARGRYRLLVFHGGPPNLHFWQALDTALDRQVALTFVDPDATLPDVTLQEILSRTLKLSRIDLPGIARVLDVANTGSGGLVVSEWIRGGSLREVADTSPSPIGGARAIQSLAAAAEVAHRSGVALSIDHPSRVRVSIDGNVALAFPATLPDATPEDDIRGIGATLYSLLINRWPLPESGVRSGLLRRRARPRRPARRTPGDRSGHPVPDLGGGGPRRPGRWRHPQRPDAAEPAAAGDRGRRPHRTDFPGRRTRSRVANNPLRRARRRGSGRAPAQGADGRAGRRRRDRRGGADRAGVDSEPDLRRRGWVSRQGRARPERPDDVGGIRRPVRRQHRETRSRDSVFARGRGRRARRRRPGHRWQHRHRLAHRHLLGFGAVPRIQERCRADAATFEAHHAERRHHQREQHRHGGADPVGRDADTVVAGRHHRVDAAYPAEAGVQHDHRG